MCGLLLSLIPLLGAVEPSMIDAPSGQEVYHIILDPKERTLLSTRITSPVEKIDKRMGDSFKKGDRLIQLKNDIYEANYSKAKEELDKAETDLEAKKSLYQDKAASLFEVKKAQADLASAYYDLVKARESFDETRVLAPYQGKVVSLFIEQYELPKQGSELIEIIRDDVLVAKFLPSSNENLKLGMPVYIKLDEADETIDAVITRISPEIDPSSKTIKVEAEINNKEGRFVAGMSGVAYFKNVADNNYD